MAEAADDEDDETDDDDVSEDDDQDVDAFARARETSIDRVRIKVEDDTADDSQALPTPRAPVARPYGEPYSRRFARESSQGSSGSDSDVFDASAVLTRPSTGSTGFTGMFDAACPDQMSPPDTTDWTLNFDLDELDNDIGSGADLLGPETVALEELDLAWADEQGEDETDDEWRARQAEHAKATSAAAAAFLTASAGGAGAIERLLLSNANKSPKSRYASPVSVHTPTPAVTPGPSSIRKSYSSRSSGRRTIGSSRSSSPLAVQPKIPLSVPVTATVIDNGLA
jgi:hypothetical protein